MLTVLQPLCAIFACLLSAFAETPAAHLPMGSGPEGGVVIGSGGVLYGVTTRGGDNDKGTIFAFDPGTPIGDAHHFVTLYSFSGSDGSSPAGPLLATSDGALYGATSYGGTSDKGTIFRFDPSRAQSDPHQALTTLYNFSGSDGSGPNGGLVMGPDGALHGTTSGGGDNGCGVVFRLDARKSPAESGYFDVEHRFQGNDGQSPSAGLAIGKNGALFGVTSAGGDKGFGTIFTLRLSASPAQLELLHSFQETDGAGPAGTLASDNSGNFYGTTTRGGKGDYGTVYRISESGKFKSMHRFSHAEGEDPQGGLLRASDGKYYGTTLFGGPKQNGTVFQMTKGGDWSLVYAFSRADGALPNGLLIQTPDGYLYGTTQTGGLGNAGVLFRMTTSGGALGLAEFGQ